MWMMSEYGWYPLLLILATPWFLHQLGTEQYGYWMLLTATVSFGGILNFGTGSATIKAVSAVVGKTGGVSGTENAVRASLAIAILGGIGLGLLVFLLYWFFGSTIFGEMNAVELLRVTGVAAALLILFEQIDNVFASSLKGAENFGAAARIEMLSKTLQVLCSALVVWKWPTLEALCWTLVGVTLIRLIAKLVVFQTVFSHKNLRPSLRGIDEVMHFAKWGWFQGIGNVLFSVADRFLVGSLLGATSLSYYSIASQLAMQIHASSAAGLSVLFPKISRKLESKESFSLWRVMKLTMGGNLVFSSVLTAVLLLFGPAILVFWVGADIAAPTSKVLPWLAVAYWLLAFNVVPYYVLLGLGKARFVSITVVAAGIVGIIVTYIAIEQLELIGAAFGRGVYAILTLTLIIPLVRYFNWGRSHADAQIDVDR
jgi:O-antigen/teichoic acid export membrane protein